VRWGLALGLVLNALAASAQTIHSRDGFSLGPPPHADAIPVKDNYFGTTIVDSVRPVVMKLAHVLGLGAKDE